MMQMPNYLNTPHLGKKRFLDYLRKVEQTDNEKDKTFILTELPIIQQTYIESTSDFNLDTYIWPPPKQILELGVSFDCIVKIIKPMCDMPKVSTTLYAIY